MSQYGETGNLVNNPRYQGQAGGTDVRGPEGESRYGATPMSTGTGNHPLVAIRNSAAHGFRQDEPEGFRYPGAAGANLADPNAHPSQAGYGSSSQPGYDQHQEMRTHGNQGFAKEQPGYGQSKFDASLQGYCTASLWPRPTAPANAHRSDLVGQDHGAPREGMVDRAKDAVGMGPNSGYDNYGNQRQEGIVDRAKDAVGMGPNSNRNNEPGYDNYGNQRQEGIVDRAKDAVGMGPNDRRNETGYGAQGYNQPRQEGIVDKAKDAIGMGPNNNRNNEPGYDNYGNQRQEGIADRAKDAVGMGPNDRRNETGYGAQGYNQPRQEGIVDKAKDAVGMGPNDNRYNQPGYDNYGNQRQEGIVDRAKDTVGMGPNDRRNEAGYGSQGYNQPRQEGIVDKAKDAVGMGPNDNRYNQPGYDNYGNQRQEGIVDRAKDTVGMGPNDRRNEAGYGSQGYNQPRQEGIVDKAKDTVGMGPNTGRPNYDASQEYDPNRDHPSEATGFGGGLEYDQSRNLGTGYENRMATGADAYGRPGQGHDDRTPTGVGAHVPDNHPAGVQDRITGVNEPSFLDQSRGNLPHGHHLPDNILGERKTAPGYDLSTGHLSDYLGAKHTTPGTEMGPRDTDNDERMGKGVEDTSAYDTKTTESDYNGTETGYGDDDTGVHNAGGAPPKKGLMTKIKEKMHHTH